MDCRIIDRAGRPISYRYLSGTDSLGTLMTLVEERAKEQGPAELALDTSEHAAALIAFYQRYGYRFIEYIQWKETNYRSMIFAKSLCSQ